MDQDFTQVLQSLLDTEEGQKGLQQVMDMLGGGEAGAGEEASHGIDSSASSPQEESSFGLDSLGINMQTILGLQKMMSGFLRCRSLTAARGKSFLFCVFRFWMRRELWRTRLQRVRAVSARAFLRA